MASPDIEGISKVIRENEVCVFTKSHCPYSKRTRTLLDSLKVKAVIVEIDTAPQPTELQAALAQYLKREKVTVPQVFVQHGAHHLGGCSDVEGLHKEGKLLPFLFPGAPAGGAAQSPAHSSDAAAPDSAATPSKVPHKEEAHGGQAASGQPVPAHLENGANELEAGGNYEYDLVVLGGGSGGLAAAKEAARLGAKVAVFDYVVPTPQGTKWGLGGTCVNVGCIPKKLMHQAALHHEGFKDAANFGWQINDLEAIKHDWGTMITNIQSYIRSLNFAYKKALKKDEYTHKVEYINAYAKFLSPHTVQYSLKNETKSLTARYFMVAVGLRPTYPADTPGAKEYCITSDDLFSLPYFPGRTLVIGASYVALECAGFMKGVGVDVTVAVRSIYLRGFDQQMAELVGKSLVDHGVRILRPCIPTKIEQLKDGKPGLYKVTLESTHDGTKTVEVEEFNTILLAIGRTPRNDLGFETIGLKTHRDGKLLVDDADRTNVPYVYAIGDIAHGGYRKELTPVAIEAGVLLARRLFANATVLAEYDTVPTTVFTPMEYGAIGFSEEEAIDKFGADNLEVYHIKFNPLEWRLRQDDAGDLCYAKLICLKNQNERVVGFHVLAANAGEITQGYAVALKLGATKADFDRTIGIHPTESEVFTTLDVTKSSGKSAGGKSC